MENKIEKNNVEDILELTPFQEGLLINYLKTKTSQYSEQLFLKISGQIDRLLFEQVWQSICNENEILRALFRWEGLKKPVIVVLKENKPAIEYIDLTTASNVEASEKIDRIVSDDMNAGFDFTQVPFRIKLIKTGDASHNMIITNHHILFDGWSTGIILKEFFEKYEAKNSDARVARPNKAKFKEFSVWVKQRSKQDEEVFWKEYLKDYAGKSAVPFANSSNTTLNISGKRKHSFSVDESLAAALKAYSRQNKVTLACILYSAWGILLSKFNDDDVLFGTTVSNRPNTIKGIEHSVGLYINTIPLVFKNNRSEKIGDLLKIVQQQLNEREKFETSSLADLGEYVKDAKDGLFDSIVVVENYPIDQALSGNLSSLKLESHYMDYLTHYLLSVVISTFKDIQVTFTYNIGVFSLEAIAKIESYFVTILHEIIENTDQALASVNLFQPNERADYALTGRDIFDHKIAEKTIVELFEAQALATPAECALQEGDVKLSYAELNAKANHLAFILQERGVKPNDTVVLFQDPSVELAISMLAALKLRALFLPLSTDAPLERIHFILKDSQSKFVCTSDKLNAKLGSLRDVAVLQVSAAELSSKEFVADSEAMMNDLAYIIYTSGTTGNPKGVMIENGSLVNYIQAAVKHYIKNERVSFPLFTSPAFDLTITSIFAPLISGNTIVIYNDDNKDFLIERLFDENKVDVVKLTPSHLRLLAEKIKSNTNNHTPSRIKRLIVGGEQFTVKLAGEITELFRGQVEIFNEYGPTEATVGCMLYKYDHNRDIRASVPIGRALENNGIYVLDENLQPVVKGRTGEIYITGLGLARGYVNNERLTNEKFVTNPFDVQLKMYKTGDLARWLPDGNLEYIGRGDRQVKLRGYRIELDEIERKLLQFGKTPKDEIPFDIIEATKKLGALRRCTRCLLPENYPSISFGHDGVCNICEEFDAYRKQIENYFKREENFVDVAEEMKVGDGAYDCLLLYSGGKDSTYVLYKLIDHGLKVLTYTFDNGYISKTAFKNIDDTTRKLGVKNIAISSKNMGKVFSESLRTNCSSCHGCWHAINTFGIQVAKEHNIRHIVSGLSRGQIYDMRLEGIFETRVFEENNVEEQLAIFRKSFHSKDNKYSRLLEVSLTGETLAGMQFVDFFRYYNTPVSQIKSYLIEKGWVQPKDTGFCSSNCLINDIGIYTHIKEKGDNFYTAPISWDVRLGQTTREEGMLEITSFGSTEKHVKNVLEEIGYSNAFLIKEAVVVKNENGDGKESLSAYIVSDIEPSVSELRSFLLKELPEYMVPSHFVQVNKIPLTSNGKIDTKALPFVSSTRPRLETDFVMPSTLAEKTVSEICKEILGVDNIGVHDNLFDLGAKSFDLTRITNKLNSNFEKKISVVSLFQLTTVQAIANYFSQPATLTTNTKSKDEDKSTSNLLSKRRMLLDNKN